MTRLLTIAHVVWLEVLRRKDIYVLFILLLAVLVLLMSLNIFGLGAVTGYVKETGLLLGWVFSWIVSVSYASRLLPEEESKGTIFPLLARPVTRVQLVAGKWLGCWSVVCAATAVFYLALVGIVLLRGSGFCPTTLLQALCLHLWFLGVITALGIAFSTRLSFDAAAAMTFTVSLAAFFILPRAPSLMLSAKGFQQTGLLVLYYAMPHLELFDMRMRLVHGRGPISLAVFIEILAYGMSLMLAFLALGWIGYRSKRFSRGSIQ